MAKLLAIGIAGLSRMPTSPLRKPGGNATRHWHETATTLIGPLRRFVTSDPATAALGGRRKIESFI
jgi:hypothetical protein